MRKQTSTIILSILLVSLASAYYSGESFQIKPSDLGMTNFTNYSTKYTLINIIFTNETFNATVSPIADAGVYDIIFEGYAEDKPVVRNKGGGKKKPLPVINLTNITKPVQPNATVLPEIPLDKPNETIVNNSEQPKVADTSSKWDYVIVAIVILALAWLLGYIIIRPFKNKEVNNFQS